MLLNILYIIIGLLLLVKGADYLVDGSVAIARWAKLSSMVIGLTIVGFGTSTPELLVSIQAALDGNSGIAIGNVVGSNIADIALILGVAAIVRPLPTTRETLRTDLPFMILACLLFVGIAMTGTIGRLPGLLLFLILVVYITWQIRQSKKNCQKEEIEKPKMSLPKAFLLVTVAFVALVFGADLLVDSASRIAAELGVSDRVIGLTIVAVGTSLPELFASVVASYKGEADIAIGNIIGSVSFNILCVVGLSATISPIQDTWQDFIVDYSVMTGVGILLWILLRTEYRLSRWEGILLTAIFIAFTSYTVANAKSLVVTLSDQTELHYQLGGETNPKMAFSDEGVTIMADQYTFAQFDSWHISEADAPDAIQLVADGNEGNDAIGIYTLDGQLLACRSLEKLPSGTYIVRTAQSALTVTKK